MKTIFDHIERVKAQPHHIRKQIAFASAAVGTALISFIWFFGVFASGTFAIQGTNFAQSTGAEASGSTLVAAPSDRASGLAGAAAALPSGKKSTAAIEVVDVATSTRVVQPEPTVIPF